MASQESVFVITAVFQVATGDNGELHHYKDS